MPFSINNSKAVGYASLSVGSDGLDRLHSFCRNTCGAVDIFAEELPPSEITRPLWQQVLGLIDEKEISLLVVPSFYQLAGDDSKALTDVLRLLKIKGVDLVILEGSSEIYDKPQEKKESRVKFAGFLNREQRLRLI